MQEFDQDFDFRVEDYEDEESGDDYETEDEDD